MTVLKTAELEMKTFFIGSKLAMTTFLSFDIRSTVDSLEVYLQSLTSLQVCKTFQLSKQKVLKPSISAVCLRDAQKNMFLMSLKSEKQKR